MYYLSHSRKAFTLIELLVVISIIALLATILMGSLEKGRARARDVRRVTDIKNIQKALELYADANGRLPSPSEYGRANDSPGWWTGQWDLSSNTSGGSFLSFLVTGRIMPSVPVDPLSPSTSFNGAPYADGYRYFYHVVRKGYSYQGGTCSPNSDIYLIGIANFETDNSRPSTAFKGSECNCLWKNAPNFFQGYHDYIICGTI